LATAHGTPLTKRRLYLRLGRRHFRTRIAIHNDVQSLGKVGVTLRYADSQQHFVQPIVNTLCSELSVHWHRVRMLVEQRLKEHKLVAEKTRGDIMARFLSQAVLSKFSGDKSAEENLASVLTARENRAALLQA